jgi:murein DD-endopeptidase MepM/ murein hydrolase activator NlpD
LIGRLFRVRSRPLFVRHALPRVVRRAGLLAPLALAVALAVVGHEVSAPGTSVAAGVAPFASTAAVEVPERAAAAPATHQSVVRKAPAQRASRARTAPKAAPAPRWVRPCGGALTSHYGMRWGRMHKGLDFGAAYGSPIYAAAAGYVTFAGAQGGYGRLVTIQHATGHVTAYGHMSRMVVRQGQRVSAGQVIAYVGSEGRSTGPHLHFEVRVGGGTIDPLPFLRARGVRV